MIFVFGKVENIWEKEKMLGSFKVGIVWCIFNKLNVTFQVNCEKAKASSEEFCVGKDISLLYSVYTKSYCIPSAVVS